MAHGFSLKHPKVTSAIAVLASLTLISLNNGCRGIVAAPPITSGPPATTLALTVDTNPAPVGAKVTFTAKVSDPAATGNVTFNDGATALGTAALSSGSATISTSTLAPGSHSITAVYAGDASHAGSTSPALAEVISGIASSTTLTADVNPAQIGTKVTFKATVAPAGATGNVTFNDGTTALGTAALASSVATFSTSTLAIGSHTITAVYAGDSTHAASTSAAVTEVIQLVADIHAINHVVVMLQENRSFDSYFGKLGDYRQANGYGVASDIDGLPNPPPSNPQDTTDTGVQGSVTSFHFQTACIENLTPDWLESHGDYHLFDAGSNVFLGNGYVHNGQGMAGFSGFVTETSQPRGSVKVSPSKTTHYYLFANHSGTVLAQLTINVSSTQTNSFFADPQTIASGNSTLQWSIPNATTVTIKDQAGNLVGTFTGASGSAAVSPTTTTTYNLSATVGTNTVNLSTTVQVSTTQGLFFNASNTNIGAGQSATIQWNVPNAKNVLVDTWFDQEGRRSMGYYDSTDLPYYYFMASNFATSDRFFSPNSSNSEPNRIYLFSATSHGHVHDPGSFDSSQVKNIFQLLDAASITWKVYYQSTDSTGAPNTRLSRFQPYATQHAANVVPDSQYFTDLKNGTLPQVAFIEELSGFDEHPGGTDEGNVNSGNHIQVGANFVSQHINAFMQSTSWKDGVFFLSWDEGGGLYDHVSPQPAVHPDGIKPVDLEPKDMQFISPQGDFNRTGFRVPMMVVSPYAKKNYVSHTVADYTAFLKFIETRFALPSLTARDAAQIDMTEFFNFANPPWLVPPASDKIPVQPINIPCDYTNLH